jgi:hypothetical protein
MTPSGVLQDISAIPGAKTIIFNYLLFEIIGKYILLSISNLCGFIFKQISTEILK